MSDLLDLQFKFTTMVGSLINYAFANGWNLTFGEAYRTPEQAALNAQKGTGIANSLHTQRLAVDLNLFRGTTILTNVEDYLPLGVYWESLGGSWGGRFTMVDADHFSLSPDGGKTR